MLTRRVDPAATVGSTSLGLGAKGPGVPGTSAADANRAARVLDAAAESATARALEREAARNWVEAVASLQKSGQRAEYRRLLDAAIDAATRALAATPVERARVAQSAAAGAEAGRDKWSAVVRKRARATLVRAYAAKAEDALHGAGQLSLSAQRAPTRDACEDGWSRVETIVAGGEVLAQAAAAVASEATEGEPGAAALRTTARRAEAAALSARKLFDERNHAYTFHTDGGFSFGEGWYLAAAGVLAGVTIQIEPGKDGERQAELFLREAGLAPQLVPYRSRPRAMKQVTEIVGRAFAADPAAAQQKLRAAFLAGGPTSEAVRAWVDARLEASNAPWRGRKVLVWIRDGVHHPGRNTSFAELLDLVLRVKQAGLVPVLIGDALREERIPADAVDMILFWKDPLFRRVDTRRAQLDFFEHLRERHGLVGQVGVTTAGMDGPALLGLPTLYLTEAPNLRMREWVGTVPGYEEVARESGYLERIDRALRAWARGTGR